MKKRLFLCIGIILSLLLLAGCAKTNSKSTETDSSSVKKNDKEITIGYIAGSSPAAQAMIGRDDKIFEKLLSEKGYTVKWVHTRSRDNTGKLMDSEDIDFFYLYGSNFIPYMTETTQWGGSDKYRIIAGALLAKPYLLVTKPDIKSVKELDGKTVGISNHDYIEEILLNKELQKVGLKSKQIGGTVNVEYQDVQVEFAKSFISGKWDAITLITSMKYMIDEQKAPSKVLLTMTGDKPNIDYVQLLGRKELIDSNPELVKLVLKAHVMATERALAIKDRLPAMAKKHYDDYFTKELTNVAQYKVFPLDYYLKVWKPITVTYAPDLDFFRDTVDYLTAAGYLKNKTIDNVIDVTLLNEVLKEMGKPTVQ